MEVRESIVDILTRENAIIDELCKLGQEKQEMINEPESLRQIAEKEIECLTVLEELENERVLLFDIIAPGLTLEDWLDRSNDDLSDVKKLAITLKENFIKLRELNDINMELMKESLAFVQFSLNVLIGDDTPVTYGKASSQLARRSVIDKKV
ncbi:MAG: flagellar protein FlgN [Firmicutes bacterium]|nr:flagellar protein FlgN [Bacillota bacterium]